MSSTTDSTHDPVLRSWVATANEAGTEFPIQNLPFGVFRADGLEAERVGVAIGDQVVDVWASFENGAFGPLGDDESESPLAEAAAACAAPTLNPLMALGRTAWRALRGALQTALLDGSAHRDQVVLRPQDSVEMVLPVDIGDYTDFYASVHHATNVGSLFRPDNPLLPNYKHIPIGYHGRASSIVVSGTPVRRPQGQVKAPDAETPSFQPSARLDYELEVGFFVGPGNRLGSSPDLDASEDRIFGFCLVNDWSARDVQAWEYQPLGPFLAKSFQTSIAPWIITVDALEPYRIPAYERPEGDPEPLPHLDSKRNRARGGVDLQLEALLLTAKMRDDGDEPVRLSRGSFRWMYWTPAQMLAHHASNGCDLRPGDLLASGTVSGPDAESRGCLLELTSGGKQPLRLPNGEERRFLEDGDELILRGHCEREGAVRIGLGECRGVVEAARNER